MSNHLEDQRDAAIASARTIIQGAKSAGRDMSTAEARKVDQLIQLAKSIRDQDTGDRLRQELSANPDEKSGEGTGYLDFGVNGRRRMAAQFASKMTESTGLNQKTLIGSGDTVLPIPMIPNDPISLAKMPLSLLDVLPTVQIQAGALANYVRQGTRTNNAAAVTPGNTKPTSILALSGEHVSLKVYATLSEPVDKFLVSDSLALGTWLSQDLLYCVNRAVEADVIAGDPTANPASITGLLNTSGIVSQAFTSNLLTSLRAAKTTAEATGYDADLIFALSAADWAAAEQARASTGGTLDFASAPGEAAPKKVWGVPLVTVTGLPAKTGLLINRSSVGVYTDSTGIRLDWGSPSDTWSKNQLVARCEGRFDLAVYQPNGVIRIGTAA